MTDRKGDWLQTFTGIAFYPLDPRPDDIDLRDIAHALAYQCRYGGHSKFFYSVAEHSVLLSGVVPRQFALSALMHDAAEAYLVDVPRPIKSSLVGCREIEAGLERAIFAKFNLPFPNPPEVMALDTQILTDERRQLMATAPMPWGTDMEPLGVRVIGYAPMRAEDLFLRRFAELTK